MIVLVVHTYFEIGDIVRPYLKVMYKFELPVAVVNGGSLNVR